MSSKIILYYIRSKVVQIFDSTIIIYIFNTYNIQIQYCKSCDLEKCTDSAVFRKKSYIGNGLRYSETEILGSLEEKNILELISWKQ